MLNPLLKNITKSAHAKTAYHKSTCITRRKSWGVKTWTSEKEKSFTFLVTIQSTLTDKAEKYCIASSKSFARNDIEESTVSCPIPDTVTYSRTSDKHSYKELPSNFFLAIYAIFEKERETDTICNSHCNPKPSPPLPLHKMLHASSRSQVQHSCQ